MAEQLRAGRPDLDEARVAFLVEPGGAFVAVLWGIWEAGGVAVPLAVSHPPAEHRHVLTDSGAEAIVVDASCRARILPVAGPLGIRVIHAPAGPQAVDDDQGRATDVAARKDVDAGDPAPTATGGRRTDTSAQRALMIYTSGTTGRPKGAVHTHGSVRAQVEMLVDAWGWRDTDRTLLVLPLHHVHGLINVVGCGLWIGAHVDMLDRFDADRTWDRIEAGNLTVFMAVPTIYARLIAAWEGAPEVRRERMSAGCRRMRLMVSGSAALPVPTLERWRALSGHVLLERYGMTELGMALSNPLDGERRPGHVGLPLPGVEVRLVDDDGSTVGPGTPGEIEVRGPALFLEYWGRPEETRAAFRDGWFRTGDMAVLEDGAYRILGRRNVDILKTAGYKVSALEIEDVLRTHPGIDDCAVVGIPDIELGERIVAAVIGRSSQTIEPEALRAWLRERIAPYKVPSLIRTVEALPRNAMGKVTKPAVRTLFEEPPS